MRAESIAEQLFFTTCHITARSSVGGWTGTGFIYAVETTAGTAHFLITNKHVLAGAEEIDVRMLARTENGEPWLGQATEITVKELSADSWRGHSNPDIDVAVMPLGRVFDRMAEIGAPPFFRSVSPEICLGVGSDVEPDALESVTFIGYPAGIFDPVNYLPIMRRGTTATPISVDYRGVPVFLIDASVFPGSSGSPVFLSDTGMYTVRGGNSVFGGSRIACLGVLAAVHTRPVSGTVAEAPTRLVASFDEPIDLGIVYRAECIDACVQELLDAAGLMRKASTEPLPAGSPPTVADAAVEESQP